MEIETLRKNARLIKENGLDSRVLSISQEALKEGEKRVRNISPASIIFPCDNLLNHLLGLYSGHVERLKILDLGCGDGDFFAPILAESLSYLGANVDGIDIEPRDKDRFGFNYINFDLLHLPNSECWGYHEIIIAKNILACGLKFDEGLFSIVRPFWGALQEWESYKGIVNKIRLNNKKESLYVLEAPSDDIFKTESNSSQETLKKKNLEISSVTKEILLRDIKHTKGETLLEIPGTNKYLFSL